MKTEYMDQEDRFHQFPVAKVSGKGQDLRKIWEGMWRLFPDGTFKYAIIIDQSHDEYQEMPDETYVYTLDCILREVFEYAGKENVLWELEKIGWLSEGGRDV